MLAKEEVEKRKRMSSDNNATAEKSEKNVKTSIHRVYDNIINKREMPFEAKEVYEYADFTKYHDLEFVENAYKGLFGRVVDSEGLEHYLNLLRSGDKSKSEIISLLRYSKEGKRKGVKLLDFKKRFLRAVLYKIPIIGYVSKLLLTFVTLPRLLKRLNSYENYVQARNTVINELQPSIDPKAKDEKIKLGWVSTWNTKCGIAAYSKFLIDNFSKDDFDITIFANYAQKEDLFDMDEEKNVKRVWKDANEKELDILYNSIEEEKIDILVIQFNFGFFNLYVLENLIKTLHKLNIKIFITLHSVADVNKNDFKASLGWISQTLSNVKRLIVHNISDLDILKSFGLVDNITLFPHGVVKRIVNKTNTIKMKKRLNIENKKVIASYGFLLPPKGIKELIEAFAIVQKENNNLHLLLVNALHSNPISNEYLIVCQESIKILKLENSITMINDFLSDKESFVYLDCADLLVMPYKETQESSSAAVRHAISTYRPVLCTPINIFRDVGDIVYFSKNSSVGALAQSINKLINNDKLLHEKSDIQEQWIDEHDWVKVSNLLLNILVYEEFLC